MIVEQENLHRIRVGICQVDLTQDLKCLCGNLPRIRSQSVRHLESVLVSLMFEVSADSATYRVRQKKKH